MFHPSLVDLQWDYFFKQQRKWGQWKWQQQARCCWMVANLSRSLQALSHWLGSLLGEPPWAGWGLESGQLKWCPEWETGPDFCRSPNKKHQTMPAALKPCTKLGFDCTADFALMKPQTPPQITFSRQWALLRHKVIPSASAEEQMEGKSTCNRDDLRCLKSQPWCWHTQKGREDDFKHELWTLTLGDTSWIPNCSSQPKFLPLTPCCSLGQCTGGASPCAEAM